MGTVLAVLSSILVGFMSLILALENVIDWRRLMGASFTMILLGMIMATLGLEVTPEGEMKSVVMLLSGLVLIIVGSLHEYSLDEKASR